jgi:hypothetical protein
MNKDDDARERQEQGREPDLAPAAKDPWNRAGVYVRLTKRRKARLREIAKELGCDDSPHQAIAARIESAGVTAPALGPDLDGAAMDRIDGLSIAVASLEERMASMIGQLGEALSPLVEAVAPAELLPSPASAWLANVRSSTGAAVAKLALARMAWTATQSGPDGRLSMEFDADLVNIDGLPAKASAPVSIRLDGIDPHSRFAHEVHSKGGHRIVLACQPAASGRWTLAAFWPKPDGSLDEKFATLSI